MKTFFSLLICFFFGKGFLTAQQQISIKGVAPAHADKSILLNNATGKEITIPVKSNGSFEQLLPAWPKGFYTLRPLGQVFLAPGHQLTLRVGGPSIEFSGKGALENNLVQQLSLLAKNYLPLDHNNILTNAINFTEPDVFQQKVEAYRQAAIALLDSAGADPFFVRIKKADLGFEIRLFWDFYSMKYGIDPEKQILYNRLMMISPGENTPKDTAAIEAAYKAMRPKRFSKEQKEAIDSTVFGNLDMNDLLLFEQSSNYRQLLNRKIQFLMYRTPLVKEFRKGSTVGEVMLMAIEPAISNRVILEYQVFRAFFEELSAPGSKGNIDSLYGLVKKYITNPVYLEKATTAYNNTQRYGIGAMAPAASFQDIYGNAVTLASLRGKYAFIDVWATWCTPCKEEIPFLKKLVEKYQAANIYFVSISLDRPADRAAWAKMVQEKSMDGIQLIADKAFESEFARNFNITAIPRFLLIDPGGRIVMDKAKRPSDPALVNELDALLKLK